MSYRRRGDGSGLLFIIVIAFVLMAMCDMRDKHNRKKLAEEIQRTQQEAGK